jgi:thiol-disulfide isomerase/thioredoxin
MVRCLWSGVLTWAVLSSLALASSAAEPKELLVGDAAPALTVKTFVKGEPVKSLEKGKIYVLDFWATFCGPCLEAIPHVSELQSQHKDVVFIGIDVREQSNEELDEQVAAVVKKLGNKITFRIAIDAIDPDAEDDNSGKMARNWLDASHQFGIPCAAIVDKAGKVAWIGDPREMDEPLEKIVAGKWDLEAAAKKYKAAIALIKAGHELIEAVNAALEGDDPLKVIKVLDAGFAKTPAIEKEHCLLKLTLMLAAKDQRVAGLAYGEQLVTKLGADNPTILYSVANEVLTNDEGEPLEKLDPATGKLAILAATRFAKVLTDFDRADDEDRSVAHEMVAQAHFATGNATEAVTAQQKAIEVAQGTSRQKDKSLAEKLRKYQLAAAAKPRVAEDPTKTKAKR